MSTATPSATAERLPLAYPALLRCLCWHSRRGMLELDLLLLPFATDVLPQLPPAQLQAYQRLLACEDQQLYACLVRGEAPPDGALDVVVQAVRAHAETASLGVTLDSALC